MLQDSEAVAFTMNEADVEPGLPLICILPGIVDAGQMSEQLSKHFRKDFHEQRFASFKPDKFLNYREHRPDFYFDGDNFQQYSPPTLKLQIHQDEVGRKFLLLVGYEPDFGWDRFIGELRNILRQLSVTDVYWFQSIPFPVPHTREIGVAASGNRAQLIERYSDWQPKAFVPASLSALMEYRLLRSGFDCSGFTLLVPHYLADVSVPLLPLKVLEIIASAVGLIIPADAIRARVPRFMAEMQHQMELNPELARMVQALEQGYDKGQFNPLRTPLRNSSSNSFDAEEIAADLEDYLANLAANDDPNDGQASET